LLGPVRKISCAKILVLLLLASWSWFCIAVLAQRVLIVRANSANESAMSTIGASGSNDLDVQVRVLGKPGQQSGAAQSDAASQLFAPTSAQGTNTPASMERSA
jgi:hypothetical protein